MFRYLYLFLLFFCISCDNTTTQSSQEEKQTIVESSQEKQIISKQQALEIAKKFFLELNCGPIEQYKFNISTEGKKQWIVLFVGQGKFAGIGNNGFIYIDKKTGATKYIPGR